MKIQKKVPTKSKIQQWTLAYMLSIKPVSQALDDLIKAIELVADGETNLRKLPESVQQNKAFTGHVGSDNLGEFLARFDELSMLVGRGYMDQSKGPVRQVIERHLELSDCFHIGFVPTARNLADVQRGEGIGFLIFRSGEISNAFGSLHPVVLPVF